MSQSSPPVANADPLVDSPTPSRGGMDFPHHVNTYNRFLHLTKWFVIHMAILVIALYFLIIQTNGVAGSLFLVLAVGALVYGILSLPEGRAAATTAAGLSDREPDEQT